MIPASFNSGFDDRDSGVAYTAEVDTFDSNVMLLTSTLYGQLQDIPRGFSRLL